SRNLRSSNFHLRILNSLGSPKNLPWPSAQLQSEYLAVCLRCRGCWRKRVPEKRYEASGTESTKHLVRCCQATACVPADEDFLLREWPSGLEAENLRRSISYLRSA